MAENIRFYLDQHIPSAVARGLQRRGVDVLTAQEAGRCGYSDLEQLAFSVSQSRVMVTFDDDFLRLAGSGIEHICCLSPLIHCEFKKAPQKAFQ